MKGDCASLARRRAISVLPTPVGPIIRMFFGATSSASSFGNFWRRRRVLSSIATARFALCCHTTCLSSSETIWRGVSASVEVWVRSGSWMGTISEFLDHELVVRINADVGGDAHGVLGDLARVERRV